VALVAVAEAAGSLLELGWACCATLAMLLLILRVCGEAGAEAGRARLPAAAAASFLPAAPMAWASVGWLVAGAASLALLSVETGA
jgi:hypothetical protein